MVALYVHWPFCKSKCPYCDFNSHVRDSIDQARWRSALLSELSDAAARYRSDHGAAKIESIFFGGGTPSLMAPETVSEIIDQTHALFPGTADPEVTLEANPTSVEAGRFAAYRAAGVNRVSLGIQSLDDEALRFLGREHSAREALDAVDIARSVFPRHSFDLIYARSGQTESQWRRELADALTYAGDHLSLYQLTLEPGTAFMTRARQGETLIVEEGDGVALYEATQGVMSSHGYNAYEVSNHARPSGECQHNLVYWRYSDYLGIGPGAHGRISDSSGSRFATRRIRLPEKWLSAVERDEHGLEESTNIPRIEQRQEMLLMGLRLSEGVSEARLIEISGDGFDTIDSSRLDTLQEEAFVELVGKAEQRTLRVTAAGRQRLNAVLAYIL